MYVRWVVRRHKNATIANTTFHDAYLVESFRDEGGNPRQRTVCYLGNIRQIGEEFPPIERELFLLRAEGILYSIDDLSETDCIEILDMLQEKVAPLSPGEVRAAFVENVRWYRRWLERGGNAPTETELLQIIKEAQGNLGPM
ncbi:MAG: hypothetical protein HC828_15255 [Blastochloris sp.]|nr:hypothetical protein [Chloroflexaceae bacterium]NJO84005.1 hypothetical protein [Blastochloris sp.]